MPDQSCEKAQKIKRRRTQSTSTEFRAGRRPTYAQWIAKAIASTLERAMTLADINEWMIKNVPGLAEQRYLHSCKGWKNAVRHTLSINRHRFTKVPQNGKPSLWSLNPTVTATAAGIAAVAHDLTNTMVADHQLSPPALVHTLGRSSDSSATHSPLSDVIMSAQRSTSAPNAAAAVAQQRSLVAPPSPLYLPVMTTTACSNLSPTSTSSLMASDYMAAATVLSELQRTQYSLTSTAQPAFQQKSMSVQQLEVVNQADGTVQRLVLPSPLPLTDANYRILLGQSLVPFIPASTFSWPNWSRDYLSDQLAASTQSSLPTPLLLDLCSLLKKSSTNY